MLVTEYKTELEGVIKSETRGDFQKALLSLLRANRDTSSTVDMELAQRDAQVSPPLRPTGGTHHVLMVHHVMTFLHYNLHYNIKAANTNV